MNRRSLDDYTRRLYVTKPHGFLRNGLGLTCRLCGNLRKHPLHEVPEQSVDQLPPVESEKP